MADTEYAVRVEGLSKIYPLWDSPADRLMYPFRRLWRSVSRDFPAESTTSRGYREFHALHDITVDIRKGESWGIIGVNGSGKSTLLKIISGNLRPSAGRVEVDGKVVILDYGSGFNGELTGEENVHVKGLLMGLTSRQIAERFDSIAEFAELGDFIRQPVKTYSSGMVARLGFAIVAHTDADIIITDEALAVGDIFFVQKCMGFIRSFLGRGTFLFVSHSTNDVLSLCQNAIWLEHGRVRAIGPSPSVVNAYLGTKALERAAKRQGEPGLDGPSGTSPDTTTSGPIEIVFDKSRLSRLMQHSVPRARTDERLVSTREEGGANFIAVSAFPFDSGGFGAGGARIVGVTCRGESGSPLAGFQGAELVRLCVEVVAERDLRNPIVGFQVKDRLGQSLFADNTHPVFQEQLLKVCGGTGFEVEFTFQMPLLPRGEYVVRVAIAEGKEEGLAVPLHVLDNALALRSDARGPRHGLVGVPMESIRVRMMESTPVTDAVQPNREEP